MKNLNYEEILKTDQKVLFDEIIEPQNRMIHLQNETIELLRNQIKLLRKQIKLLHEIVEVNKLKS